MGVEEVAATLIERFGVFAVLGLFCLYFLVRLYQSDSPLRKTLEAVAEQQERDQDRQEKLETKIATLEAQVALLQERNLLLETVATHLRQVAKVWRNRAISGAWRPAEGKDEMTPIDDIFGLLD